MKAGQASGPGQRQLSHDRHALAGPMTPGEKREAMPILEGRQP